MRLAPVLFAIALCASCAHRGPVYPAETAALESLVPEGASTLLFVDLASMRSEAAFSGVLDALLTGEDRRILEAWLRVPLAAVDRVVVADFPAGYVVLLEGHALDARRVVRDASVQMGQIEIRDDRPFPRRVGRLGVERRELVALSDDRLAIGGEDGAAMIALLACARGQSTSVLDTEAGRALRSRLDDAPTILLAAVSPMTLTWTSDVAVLLARHQMLGMALAPSDDPAWLALRVGIVGDLPPGADENLRHLAESIASSAVGGLFGMREGDSALRVSEADHGATIVHRIAARSLATGLREILRAELGEIGAHPDTAP